MFKVFALLPFLLSLAVIAGAQESRHSVKYPKGWQSRRDVPIFPSPELWFRYRQRYAYSMFQGKRAKDKQAKLLFLNGYGEFYETFEHKGQHYESMTWLSSADSEDIQTQSYQRIVNSRLENGMSRMSWFSLGFGKTIFNDEVLAFDYPLTLGKEWSSKTKFKLLPLHYSTKVVAFIPHNAQKSSDIIVQPGENYELPFAIEKLPLPLAELGSQTLKFLERARTGSTRMDWLNVRVPAGENPNHGVSYLGYYVIQTKVKLLGKLVYKQELWKDIRGAVPVYKEFRSFPLVLLPEYKLKWAEAWSGN